MKVSRFYHGKQAEITRNRSSAEISGNTLELEYARQYRDLYTRHWWWRAREQAILRVIRRRLGSSSGLRILDVGCGDGLFFERLAEFGDVEGVETDKGLVNPQGPFRERIRIAPFDTNFPRGTLRPLLRQAGFAILEERYWYQWTCPVKFVIRMFESILHRPPAVARVPPNWINRLLYWISYAEQETLGAIGMPFGSTLMVYCTKQGTH
jgi:SAM-dependent methyltransferase